MMAALVLVALVVAFLTVVMYWTPNFSPARYFFSRTVAPGFASTEPAQRILRGYRRAVLFIGAATIALGFVFPAFMLRGGVVLAALTFVASFLRARRAAAAYAVPVVAGPVREASLETHSTMGFGWTLVTFGPVLILSAAALYVYLQFDQIPERIPRHWGPRGLPDAWTTRTPLHVFTSFLIGVYPTLLLIFLSLGVERYSRASEDFKRVMFCFLCGMAYFLALTFAFIGLHPVPLGEEMDGFLFLLVLMPALWIGAVTWYAMRKGIIGGGGLRRSAPPSIVADATAQIPDDRWKAGLFYYNPDDAALLVQRRFGFGLDVNFAHPLAWVILGMALLPAVLAPILAALSLKK